MPYRELPQPGEPIWQRDETTRTKELAHKFDLVTAFWTAWIVGTIVWYVARAHYGG